jgi:acetoacetyl-CoA reductase
MEPAKVRGRHVLEEKMAQRVAVVTGGTRGIGAAVSRMLKDKGYKVAATYAGNDAAAQKFKAETGIAVYKFDVCDFAACQTAVGQIEKDLGPVDVLVNNAGITRDSTMRRLTRDMWEAVIDTNLGSCFNMSKAVWEGMNTRGFGRIVNIGSINGQGGQYGQVNYAAAKSGIHGFTKALAQEGASKGITVNAIAPGYTEHRHGRGRAGQRAGKDRGQDPGRTSRQGRRDRERRGVLVATTPASSPARRCRSTAASICTDNRTGNAMMGPAPRRPLFFLRERPMAKLTEYKDMNPRAKAVVEGIARARGIDPADINNVWKALARHPDVMERFAAEMKAVMAPGKLDGLTKELIYLAVSSPTSATTASTRTATWRARRV